MKKGKTSSKGKMFCERLKSSFIPIHDAVKLALTIIELMHLKFFLIQLKKMFHLIILIGLSSVIM